MPKELRLCGGGYVGHLPSEHAPAPPCLAEAIRAHRNGEPRIAAAPASTSDKNAAPAPPDLAAALRAARRQ